MSRSITRRRLLETSATGVGYWVAGGAIQAATRSPNERLNIAFVGAGGRGAGNVRGLDHENIVAFCDVDQQRAGETYEAHPNVERFTDYRRLFDKRANDFDAVVVSTPDHMHAIITLAALDLGKHVYCEKPLTRTIAEARRVADAAKRAKVATQMGNGGMATDGARRTVEIIRSGAIGAVHEVHAWTDRPGDYWRQGLDRPTEAPATPSTLDWDLWLGVAAKRPYHSAYVPSSWRGWFDYGTGALGDMACHVCNVAFWALDLGAPSAVEAETSPRFAETFPAKCRIRWTFPATGDRPAVALNWYEADQKPPADLFGGEDVVDNGILFVGEQGRLYCPSPNGSHGMLLPREKFADFVDPAPTLPRVRNHHQEWVDACKAGKTGMSHFEYAGAMTEALLVGNLAVRVGDRIEWDAGAMKVTNVPAANAFVDPSYRTGW